MRQHGVRPRVMPDESIPLDPDLKWIARRLDQAWRGWRSSIRPLLEKKAEAWANSGINSTEDLGYQLWKYLGRDVSDRMMRCANQPEKGQGDLCQVCANVAVRKSQTSTDKTACAEKKKLVHLTRLKKSGRSLTPGDTFEVDYAESCTAYTPAMEIADELMAKRKDTRRCPRPDDHGDDTG